MRIICLSILMTMLFHSFLQAQGEVDERPSLGYEDGLGVVTPDSLYMVNFRFRMQNRAELISASATDLSLGAVDARVRRLRLRIDGFLMNPKFAYYIQLSFSRGDQDFDDTGVPNVVRDAMVYYYPNQNGYLGFGQGKLPGNRQRVISSGQQQFAERSTVNAFFNIDRDFGLFGYYTLPVGGMVYRAKGAITTGEGRNAMLTNAGLAYTGRLEWLPLGSFLMAGDFSEGDLERHPTPKIAFGLSWHYNQDARRTRGQTGLELLEERDLRSFIADFILKYQGLAWSAEYLQRKTNNPITSSEDYLFNPLIPQFRYVFAGEGFNTQLSYLFMNDIEIAGRYSNVWFEDELQTFEQDRETISLGLSRYIRGHRVKLQCNVSYNVMDGTYALDNNSNFWSSMFQVEIGI